MKNLSTVLLLVLMAVAFAQCNSMLSRKERQLPQPDRVVFQCNDQDWSSDREFIRARGQGTSRNESTAHRMAELDANVNLARAVEEYQKKVEAFRDNRQMEKETTEVEWEGSTLSQTEINMSLRNVAAVCSQSELEDNMYTVVKIVEIPLSQIIAE
ncbi:MAG: hypothetical protein ACOCX0_06390 [Bacteroidota bacterium]